MESARNEDGFALRSLDELIARGEALIEARRNPEKGRKTFPDFGEDYHDWYIAGKELIAELSGPSAAKKWSARWCRGMHSLVVPNAAMWLKEQERQLAMLVELRARFGSYAGSSAEPDASESAPRSGKPAQGTASETEKAEAASGRGQVDLDRLYAMKPLGRDLKDEELLEDLRRAAKALGKNTLSAPEYPFHGRFPLGTYLTRFGTWNKALTAAGLEINLRHKIPTQELFENMARVWQAVGRQPVQTDMVKPLSEISACPYRARFGGWLRAVKAFVAWANNGTYPEETGAKPKTPRVPSARLRFAVLQRDSFKCTACGRNPANDPGVKLHVDHKIPWSRGGRTTLDNLTTLCEKCNLGKGDI